MPPRCQLATWMQSCFFRAHVFAFQCFRETSRSGHRDVGQQLWLQVLQGEVPASSLSQITLFSDCSGMDAPGHALDGCSWASTCHVSGSDSDPRIRDLLVQRGVTVHSDMADHKPEPDPHAMSVYVAGTPCQGFSLRNPRKRKWDDPRSTLLGHAIDKVGASKMKAAIVENSSTLLTCMPLGLWT